MKKLITVFFAIIAASTAFSQTFFVGSDMALSQPVSTMKRTMNSSFGVTLNFGYQFKVPFYIGTEFAVGTYGSKTTPETYTFGNGDVTQTDVVVTNNIYSWNFSGKYFLRSTKKVNPYISGKVGMSWFVTDLTIEDPGDRYSCHPIESEKLMKDYTPTAAIGGGIRIDMSAIFKNMQSQRFYIDASVHSLQGGTIRYMNAQMSAPTITPDSDVSARFINTTTQMIHEHHVGYVYSSILSFVDYRLGIIVKPGWQN